MEKSKLLEKEHCDSGANDVLRELKKGPFTLGQQRKTGLEGL